MAESIFDLTLRSIYISSTAAAISFLLALIIALKLLDSSDKTRSIVIGVFEALVGVPTTVVGLLIYMLLSPRGPLGALRLLYTPIAIIIGETLVALPIAFTSMFRHLQSARYNVRELILALGLTRSDERSLLLRETAPILLSSYFISFARAIGELGVALIAGGGIEGYTSVLTTAIALQTSIGNYEYAIQLGCVLISITMLIIIPLRLLGERVYGA
ncbi:MAG: ABC transporter permease [Desulfurococcaceae archaeon]